jgi:hypothetical protein
MSETEVIQIMGQPRDEGVEDSSDFKPGGWSDMECLPYRDIRKIGRLYYLVYYNLEISTRSLRREPGSLFVIVYFNEDRTEVVCVRKHFVLY